MKQNVEDLISGVTTHDDFDFNGHVPSANFLMNHNPLPDIPIVLPKHRQINMNNNASFNLSPPPSLNKQHSVMPSPLLSPVRIDPELANNNSNSSSFQGKEIEM